MGAGAQMASGFSWADYIDDILSPNHRSLSWLAKQLAKGGTESEKAIRKGLTRLRGDPHGPGGKYGALLVARYPSMQAETIGRALGQYHGPAADLPRSVRSALIRAHDRPPFSDLPAAAWLRVARASVAVSEEMWDDALGDLEVAVAGPEASLLLGLEVHSVRAFVFSRTERPRARAELDRMDGLLRTAQDTEGADDLACYRARWADQSAYELYKPFQGPPDVDAAERLYAALPTDGPPFVRLRRALGLSVAYLLRGEVLLALEEAQQAAHVAGDLGLLRLRAQALRQHARCERALGNLEEFGRLDVRARAIAERLEDRNLMGRIGEGR